jgi:hypothetical protein
MSISLPKLLVYIPAYSDFIGAGEQSRKIKSREFQSEIQVVTIISVNAVDLTNNEITILKESCDTLIYHRENLGGDTNINLGYLRALSEGADFYWVLSANDNLVEAGINRIIRALIDLNEDLIIIGNENSRLTGSLNNVFLGDGASLPIGLISSVVYKTEKFKNSFASALKFAWTGWGQLSVIQNAIFEHGSLSYKIINESSIYDRSSKIGISDQWERNKNNYRHSFFGYPLLASLLFENDKRTKKRIIRNWLGLNWYKIRFFKEGKSPYNSKVISTSDAFWTGPLSKNSILFSGVFSPILYFAGNLKLIYKLRRFPPFYYVKTNIVQKRLSRKP